MDDNNNITWKQRWREQDKERLLELLMMGAFFALFVFPYLTGIKQIKCNPDKTVFFDQCEPVRRGP